MAAEAPTSSEQIAHLTNVDKLRKDIRAAADLLSEREARYLVDAYYSIQEHRIEAQNQVRSLTQNDEPNAILGWLFDQHHLIEREIAKVLDDFTDQHVPGVWAKSITGIGPIIAAGMLAHIDITKAPTVGHIWRFAGYDPTREWYSTAQATSMIEATIAEIGNEAPGLTFDAVIKLAAVVNVRAERLWDMAIPRNTDGSIKGKGEPTVSSLAKALSKRPWNASLKVVCWKAGESFVKVSGNDRDYYGKVYKERKELEVGRNEAGMFAEQAAATLAAKKIGKSTDAYAAYSQGLLPPARIHARAKRYAVKLFLAHLHHVMYVTKFGTPPPKPYVIEHGGHTHFLAPPNWAEFPGEAGKITGEVQT